MNKANSGFVRNRIPRSSARKNTRQLLHLCNHTIVPPNSSRRVGISPTKKKSKLLRKKITGKINDGDRFKTDNFWTCANENRVSNTCRRMVRSTALNQRRWPSIKPNINNFFSFRRHANNILVLVFNNIKHGNTFFFFYSHESYLKNFLMEFLAGPFN